LPFGSGGLFGGGTPKSTAPGTSPSRPLGVANPKERT
jgi:hypothetical protein